jgi:hypothetical protein
LLVERIGGFMMKEAMPLTVLEYGVEKKRGALAVKVSLGLLGLVVLWMGVRFAWYSLLA